MKNKGEFIAPLTDAEVGEIPGLISVADYQELIKDIPDQGMLELIYEELAWKLGSYPAARLWLTIDHPHDFTATPLELIRAGDIENVLAHMRVNEMGAYG